MEKDLMTQVGPSGDPPGGGRPLGHRSERPGTALKTRDMGQNEVIFMAGINHEDHQVISWWGCILDF